MQSDIHSFVKLCIEMFIFCFLVKQRSFLFLLDFLRTGRALILLDFLSFSSQSLFQSSQPAHLKLTFLHSQWIRNLNAIAYLPKNAYLCVEMSGKGSISRMSDECLMKWKRRFPYCTCCQAVTRKFTLVSQALNYFGSPVNKGRPVFEIFIV